MAEATIEELFTERDIARIFRKSIASVRKDRQQGKGPRWIRIGSLVRYRPGAVREFLDACSQGGTGAAA